MTPKKTAAHMLAFDLGAESGRAVVGKLQEGRLSIREIHRFANTPLQVLGHLHWDVYSLLEEIRKAMRLCTAEIPGRLESLAVDTWGVDFGLLARDGSLLGLPFCYRDPRTKGAMEEFFNLVTREALYDLTGIQFMPFNSLFQLYSMVRDRSPLLDAGSDLLFMPDLFSYLLTGMKHSEFTIATTSQMFNPRTGAWNPGLFQAMGLSKDILEDVIPPGTVLGPLLRDIGHHAGLERTAVIATASHDTAAAVSAVPAEGRDWAYISSGTWSLVGTEEPVPIITPEAFAANFTNEGGVGGTIRFLKNVTGLWIVQQCRRSWAVEDALGYDKLTGMAAEAEPFTALIDPDHPDFLNPLDMPEALHSYLRKTGQNTPQSKGSMIRSILESLALKYRHVIDQLRSVSGRPIRRLFIIGGGAKNSLLNQFTADATGLPVSAGPAEATAIGNLLVQAMALGHVASHEEMRSVVRNSFNPELYLPSKTLNWERAYDRFQEIIGA